MSENNKKQNFLQGAVWLAAATIIVKVIGAFYKIPLKIVIGDAGFAYFNTAYDVYSLLLTLATAGLPLALSRMISQAAALGHDRQVKRIFKACRFAFVFLSGIGTVLMLFFAKELAAYQNQPDAWIAIICLAPCAVMIGFMSSYRGFFQGQGNMRPTSVSNVLEAPVKLVVGLVLAYVLMQMTGSIPLAAGGAILGVTASCLASAIYLKFMFNKAYRTMGNNPEGVRSYRSIVKSMLAIALPITVGACIMQFLNVAEVGMYMGTLKQIIGAGQYNAPLVNEVQQSILEGAASMPTAERLVQLTADNVKGIYNFMYAFFTMPLALISPIAVSMLPAITEKITLKDDAGVRATEESSARITSLLALPCSIGLALIARPLAGLFYDGYRQELAMQAMQILSISLFLSSVTTYTNTILQSHNYAYVPVITSLLSGGVRLALVSVFVANPKLGILGVPMATLLCYVCIIVLNLIAIAFLVPQKPKLIRSLLRPLLPALLMGACVFGTIYVMENVLHIHSSILLCGAPVAVGVVVYLVGVIWCNSITREDCLLLPKGEKLAKILRLK